MTELVSFDSSTPRYKLPLLFPGQAQKEFTVNDALSSLDFLVHSSVLGAVSIPPSNPNEGDAWLVSASAQGAWSGQEDKITIFSANDWNFISPSHGMRIFDQSEGQFMHFSTSWKAPVQPNVPVGGAIIDVEARASIDELIEALRNAGILAKG